MCILLFNFPFLSGPKHWGHLTTNIAIILQEHFNSITKFYSLFQGYTDTQTQVNTEREKKMWYSPYKFKSQHRDCECLLFVLIL